MFPLVSVIIPNYNHAPFLAQRIISVLRQTHRDLEVILLDDCSTDESREIIASFALQDSRIRICLNDQNSGSAFRQWAKGIGLATGKYVWIAESDDYADLNLLQKLVDALEKYPQASLAYCQSWSVDEQGNKLDSCRNLYPVLQPDGFHEGKRVINQYMAGANIIPNASAVVFRREVALRVDAAYQTFRFSGDWLFWCQLLKQGGLVYIDEELNFFRVHRAKVTVAALRDGRYFTEGLRILDLLWQHRLIVRQTFVNKSKGWASRMWQQRQKTALVSQLLMYAVVHNRIFFKAYLKNGIRYFWGNLTSRG